MAKTHTVASGENLYKISRKYSVSVQEIMSANGLNEKSILKQGAKLRIPSITKTKIHYVGDGENLFRIGLKHNITVDKLCKLNGFGQNVRLYKGMKIKVPDFDDEKITGESSSSKRGGISNKQKSNGQTSAYYYTMKKGDTLYKVSMKYNVKLNALISYNNLGNSTVLKPGDKIKIPRIATVAPVDIRSVLRKHKNGKTYLQYGLPLDGRIIPYVSSHYKGILIYSDKKDSNVHSIENGVVSHVETSSTFGLIVFIKHPNGLVSTYSGFSSIFVKKDGVVNSGDVIGRSGVISKKGTSGILYSLQDGSRALSFDMAQSKFYR